MNKSSIIFSIFIITGVFLYAMTLLSLNNKCSGIRIFECKKKEIITENKVITKENVGDIFLKYCKSEKKEEGLSYTLDYSKCDLEVNISKENEWIKNVKVNGNKLSREEINSNF